VERRRAVSQSKGEKGAKKGRESFLDCRVLGLSEELLEKTRKADAEREEIGLELLCEFGEEPKTTPGRRGYHEGVSRASGRK